MPYIKQELRSYLDENIDELVATIANLSQTEGESAIAGLLNYTITSLLESYSILDGKWNYSRINSVVGILECVKQEFYGRLATRYEQQKARESGDIGIYKRFLEKQ